MITKYSEEELEPLEMAPPCAALLCFQWLAWKYDLRFIIDYMNVFVHLFYPLILTKVPNQVRLPEPG